MRPPAPNALRWNGRPGHYEVYYLTLTDPASGVGVWIRYTMLAPLAGAATCALWFLAMDPRAPAGERTLGRKATLPIAELKAESEPFSLLLGDAALDDRGMRGSFEDVAWDLRWEDAGHAYEHVHPLLQRARIAKTILTLPHADVEVSGELRIGGRALPIAGARGGQAHLWGSKHAASWAWIHCNDFATPQGDPRPGEFVDGVSVFVPRFGREVGPSTPVVGRFGGRDFASTSPLRVLSNKSRFTLTGWELEARDGDRRITAEIDAERDELAGVTYHDPDGEFVYCYNSETATLRLNVWERAPIYEGWKITEQLVAPRRAHFEYAQRTPIAGLPLHTQ
jgi:hypothetical protein